MRRAVYLSRTRTPDRRNVTLSFNIGLSGFAIRQATPIDQTACCMLLGEIPAQSDRFVAVDGAHGLVVGAAVAAHALRASPLAGPGIAVHVIEPCRRQGIATALIEALAANARTRHAMALYSVQRVEYGGDKFHAWQRLGFDVCETVEQHELPLDQFVPRLGPLVKRLRQRGRIPREARIVPLYAADPAAVLQLHLDHMGGDRVALNERIRGVGPGAFHPRYSRVLLIGERVAGCILGHRKSRYVMAVDATILIPEVRGGWANAWLKLEATNGALSLGITHFHFTTFDHYADTRRFTRQLGGVTASRWALMYRRIGQ
jgi:GNAT superfamily N-acetyltransferase